MYAAACDTHCALSLRIVYACAVHRSTYLLTLDARLSVKSAVCLTFLVKWIIISYVIVKSYRITRSHGSVTSVLRATHQVNGRGRICPSPSPTPLNRQSPNIAHVITSTISPHTQHMVTVAPGVTSPHIAKVTTQFFFISSLYAKFFNRPRAQAVEPILTCDTSTDAYSRRVVPFGGQNTIFSHLHPQNP